MKNLPLILILFLVSSVGWSQNNKITIRYIGNCGLHITDGTHHIYTDFPYKSGAHHYAEYDDSELENLEENAHYIFTHKHSDHYYKGHVNKILKAKKGKKYGKWNIKELEKLSEVLPEFKIEAFKTKHLFTFVHYSYLITWHGKRIFLSGDTEYADILLSIDNMDWAFIPAWLVDDINASEKRLDTKKLAIYHIGPRDKINITGDKVLMLNQAGMEIILPY